MNLILAALARSGSTALAGVMHSPPRWHMMIEPKLFQWRDSPPTSDHVGVKQVFPDKTRAFLVEWPEAEIVVLVRDPFDVVASLWEKSMLLPLEGDNDKRLNGFIERSIRQAQILTSLVTSRTHRVLVIDYDDMCHDPPGTYRRVTEYTGWPCDGTPRSLMPKKRRYELDRHSGGRELTVNSLYRRDPQMASRYNETTRRFYERFVDRCPEFFERFHYAIRSSQEAEEREREALENHPPRYREGCG